MNASIVLPTFNRADSLSVTLAALRAQSYPQDQFELIVVSDGSTDHTSKVVEEHVRLAKHAVQYFAIENGGPAHARNVALDHATGDIVVFVDDDVEPVANWLSAHMAHHAAHDPIAVLGPLSPDPARRLLDPIWIRWEHEQLQKIYRMFRDGGEYSGTHAGPIHFYSGNASVRRDLISKVGGFDVRFKRQEDVDLAMRLERECGVTFWFDPQADGIHRPHRTWASWLKIPSDYGRIDAERMADGMVSWNYISCHNMRWHWATRAFALCSYWVPSVQVLGNAVTRQLSALLGRQNCDKAAMAALSAVYNAAYYVSMRRQLKKRGCRIHDSANLTVGAGHNCG